jgi:endo-1,4-beta-mannosidase
MTIQFSVHRRVEIAQFSGIFDDSEVGVDSNHLRMAKYGYCS